MKNRKRLVAFALVLSLAALSGCGPKPSGSAGSGSASGSGSGSSDSITPMDLSQVTDPALAVAGVAGEEVLVRLGTAEITANDYLYWLQRSISDYLEPFGGQMTTLPWDTEMSDGLTFGQYMLDNALDAAALHCMLRELARQENLTPDPDVATQVDKQYAAMVVQAGSDESRVIHTLWTQMLTRDLLINLNENTELFSQLAELYYGENSGHYPTDAEVNAYLDEVGRYKAKHILLDTIDLDALEALDVLQLWKQAEVSLDRSPQGFRLTKPEQDALRRRNTAHEKPLKSQPEVEDILQEARSGAGYVWEEMTVSDFKAEHALLRSYSVEQIGRALDRVGVSSHRVQKNGNRKWVRTLPRAASRTGTAAAG